MTALEKSFYSKASMYSFIVVLTLFGLMWIGTGRFSHMDWMLFGYMVSSFVFFIGMTVRLTSWMMRPATHEMIKRSIENMKSRKRQKRNARAIAKTMIDNIILQKFIFKRGVYRGMQHWLIAWGCIGSLAITFSLTFGWMHFKLVDPETYQVVVFNIPTLKMTADGLLANMFYEGLNITASMLMIGLVMALFQRIKSKDLKVTSRAEFDLFPLYILLAVTLSGLLLTVSYKLLGGWMHPELALMHQITVVIFLIYFPFGKLFHLPVRPLATAVPMNYTEAKIGDTKECAGCAERYSTDDQIADVKTILDKQAFDLKNDNGDWLADYCPACRRKIRVMSQLNLPGQKTNPVPVQTNNGIHVPGFGRKRSESFYSSMNDKGDV
ncbi:MFS transporter [Salipaludibacillus agaradhaerens]|uniref:MFS transporter n=1 Tax=Salipaludibacillus agaradhaerens TaxID=76935 RepID=UPI0021514243|nr:MFS transporter [Salipaludibacillus agaradhaerens]MCR6107355.1 MFS transporter [Salipaludibacillus agaradhaerens]MCR6119384.1 MFS transporter [Salipaludibacillus agaradhaerens]UJW58415.1 MFS transporter [Bacillus sp. A116_S68]